MTTTPSTAIARRASGTDMQVGAGQMGTTEFEAIERQANMLAASSIVPAAFRNKPADIVAVAAVGREVGLSVMASMQSIHIIEGKPSMSAQLMGALVRARGHSLAITKMEDDVVEIVGTRVDNGNTMRFSFSKADAAAAGLAHKANWQKYFRAMAQARCLTQVCRGLFADVIAGISYNPEEAADIAGVDVAVDLEGEVVEIAGEVIPNRVVPESVDAPEEAAPTTAADTAEPAETPKRAVRRKRPEETAPTATTPAAAPAADEPAEPLIGHERFAAVTAAVKTIPEECRMKFGGWATAHGIKWGRQSMTPAMADKVEQRVSELVPADESDVEDVDAADVSVTDAPGDAAVA